MHNTPNILGASISVRVCGLCVGLSVDRQIAFLHC